MGVSASSSTTVLPVVSIKTSNCCNSGVTNLNTDQQWYNDLYSNFLTYLNTNKTIINAISTQLQNQINSTLSTQPFQYITPIAPFSLTIQINNISIPQSLNVYMWNLASLSATSKLLYLLINIPIISTTSQAVYPGNVNPISLTFTNIQLTVVLSCNITTSSTNNTNSINILFNNITLSYLYVNINSNSININYINGINNAFSNWINSLNYINFNILMPISYPFSTTNIQNVTTALQNTYTTMGAVSGNISTQTSLTSCNPQTNPNCSTMCLNNYSTNTIQLVSYVPMFQDPTTALCYQYGWVLSSNNIPVLPSLIVGSPGSISNNVWLYNFSSYIPIQSISLINTVNQTSNTLTYDFTQRAVKLSSGYYLTVAANSINLIESPTYDPIYSSGFYIISNTNTPSLIYPNSTNGQPIAIIYYNPVYSNNIFTVQNSSNQMQLYLESGSGIYTNSLYRDFPFILQS